jgi:hypothetical protein
VSDSLFQAPNYSLIFDIKKNTIAPNCRRIPDDV